jgi:hypothetical protein
MRAGQQGEIQWQFRGSPDGADGGHRRTQFCYAGLFLTSLRASTQPLITIATRGQ